MFIGICFVEIIKIGDAGNTEGIWVIQFEIDTPGGGSSSTKLQEKFNYRLERNIAPMVRDVRIKKDGKHTPRSIGLFLIIREVVASVGVYLLNISLILFGKMILTAI